MSAFAIKPLLFLKNICSGIFWEHCKIRDTLTRSVFSKGYFHGPPGYDVGSGITNEIENLGSAM